MHRMFACLGILGVSACASHETAGRATTAHADVNAGHHTHHEPEKVAVVGEAEPPHDKVVVVDAPKLVVDSHDAAKVRPVLIAPVPSTTVLNERDRDHANRTPAGPHSTASDVEITQRIRKAVVDDDNLTSAAKNVKIATAEGQVTLRGNVRDARERDTVESHARDVAGAGNVRNQIDVAK